MNINGGPEELATFIRCVNGEPTEWLDVEPEDSGPPLTARRVRADRPSSLQPMAWSPSLLFFGVLIAAAVAFLH